MWYRAQIRSQCKIFPASRIIFFPKEDEEIKAGWLLEMMPSAPYNFLGVFKHMLKQLYESAWQIINFDPGTFILNNVYTLVL